MTEQNEQEQQRQQQDPSQAILNRPAIAPQTQQPPQQPPTAAVPAGYPPQQVYPYQPPVNGALPQHSPYYYNSAAQVPIQGQAKTGVLHRWKSHGGILGAIASILLALAKYGAMVLAVLGKFKLLLILPKLLLGGGSMLLSMWAYSLSFGWAFGVGLVALIFIHECGHALAAKMRGIPTGIMVFVPFMGAFVTTKRYGKNLVEDAFIGIMGPVVGTIASVVCGLIYVPTGNQFWLALAGWGFFINLFNLLPTPPLDGGWIAPLFSPKLLAIGCVIAVVVGFRNPMIWLLLLFSAPRIIAGWKADPKTQPYYQVAKADKWKYGAAYLGLAAFLAVGSTLLGYSFVH